MLTICVQLPVANRKGLSEKLLRRRLERQGWVVWRGGLVGIGERSEYPTVKRKYEVLRKLLHQYMPGTHEKLTYLCLVHHGMPDFICYRYGFKFVEAKLENESLRPNQRVCIAKLCSLGFKVEIHRLVNSSTREAILDLVTMKRKVREKQMRLTARITRYR